MIASFILSRTLVPTMAKFLLAGHAGAEAHHGASQPDAGRTNIFKRFQRGFEARFSAFRDAYGAFLGRLIAHRRRFVTIFLGVSLSSLLLYTIAGEISSRSRNPA